MFKVHTGTYGSFSEDLHGRVEQVLNAENITQAILHAHLLIEQALVKRLEAKLARPEVLHDRKFAQLSFAQKVALYIGLYAPDPETERYLLAFNKLRNMIAHQLVDESDAVRQCLQISDEFPSPSNPMDLVRLAFGHLIFFELGAIHGVERVTANDEQQAP